MQVDFLSLLLGGILGGILGGMGMGGGTVLIPLLTLWIGLDQHLAQWINVTAFIPMSLIALFIHAKNKLIDVKPLFLILLGAIPSCVAFSFLASKISSQILGKAFGVFLIILGSINILKIFKKEKIKPIVPPNE